MKKGYVTVYFSLFLMITMSLIVGMLYGIRENAIRYRARDVIDISMRSSFAEYQKELWNRYKLLYVDAGYGNQTDSLILSEEHLSECMNENFNENMLGVFGGKDLLKLNCDTVETDKIHFATDNNAESIVYQINKWMCLKYGITDLNNVIDLFNEANTYNLFSNPNENKETLVEELETEEAPILEEWINEAKESLFLETDVSLLSVIRLILKDTSAVSLRQINENALLSNRPKNEGNMDIEYESGQTEDLALNEYVVTYMGNYVLSKPNTVLNYESEYLISGRDNDPENLESVIKRMLLIREAANLITLYTDTEKIGEIKTFSETVTTVLLNPELAPALESLIVLLWSYIEGVCDVRTLMDGEKVPLIKNAEEWKSTLADIFVKNTNKNGYERGLSYEDYLRIFLYLEPRDIKVERLMNLIEANIRMETENDDFRLDYCFDAWSVIAYVNSEYGYDYRVAKTYSFNN